MTNAFSNTCNLLKCKHIFLKPLKKTQQFCDTFLTALANVALRRIQKQKDVFLPPVWWHLLNDSCVCPHPQPGRCPLANTADNGSALAGYFSSCLKYSTELRTPATIFPGKPLLSGAINCPVFSRIARSQGTRAHGLWVSNCSVYRKAKRKS